MLSLVSIVLIGNRYLLVSSVLLFFLINMVRHSIKNNSPRKLQWCADGSWFITQDCNRLKARLRPGSVVTPFFSSLNFKLDNNKSLNVLIFPDNIDEEKFRQLRVRIKVEGLKLKEDDILTS